MVTGIHVNVPPEEYFDNKLVLIESCGAENSIDFLLAKSSEHEAMWFIQFANATTCKLALDSAHCLEIIPPIFNHCSHDSP